MCAESFHVLYKVEIVINSIQKNFNQKGGVWYAVHRYYVHVPVHCIPNVSLEALNICIDRFEKERHLVKNILNNQKAKWDASFENHLKKLF